MHKPPYHQDTRSRHAMCKLDMFRSIAKISVDNGNIGQSSNWYEINEYWQINPVTHLKVFFRRWLSKATFERKLLDDDLYAFAQVYTCTQQSQLLQIEQVLFLEVSFAYGEL